MLGRYCFRCHGAERQRGDLDIESALEARPLVKRLDLWKNVLARLRNEEMPPRKARQPAAAERAGLVSWLDREINEFDYDSVDDPGFEPVRRLTRVEYANTMRDLLGVDLDLVARFPADLSGTSGFENSANTLFMQPDLLERVITAAEDAIEAALPASRTTPEDEARFRRIFVALPGGDTSPVDAARAILDRFLLRAYRRPPTGAEVDEVLGQFRSALEAGASFEDAVKRALRVPLVSPHFLLRVEAACDTDASWQIDDWELASRLSYFLWASMPDDELLELARRGELGKPDVLASQVDRMIADRRSSTLGTVFAAQWLGFDKLGVRVRLDPIENPWCTDTLMDAMKAESAMFFVALIRDDEPITRLVDGRFTFLNEELARFYRIRGVTGEAMRRVALTTPLRGGVFGQASILATTSYRDRTSPVLRGRWILADFLGTPPPPPPPDAGEIPEEIEENDRLTMREKLELHRRKPQCRSCHDQIDPLGFSLEHYGRFGRWRERRDGRRIDARARLPDGTEFEGLEGLRRVILAKRRDDLVRQLTRKMLSYALGRQLEYYDEAAVRRAVAALERDGLRFRDLIREIVTSYPFRFKKNRATQESAGATR